MSGEFLILAALILPLVTMAGIYLTGRLPDVREGVTLVGAGALFVVACLLTGTITGGEPAEYVLGTVVPGLDLAFKLEPLGAMFALVTFVEPNKGEMTVRIPAERLNPRE